jgi:hypothetical protein
LTPASNGDGDQPPPDEAPLKVGDRTPTNRKIHPRLIVCEGVSDQAVIEALLRVHNIGGIQVEIGKGVGNFSVLLKTARDLKFNWVLLIADEDEVDEKEVQFHKIQVELKKAGYQIPQNRREQVAPQKTAHGMNPGVEILMVPWDKEKGCIETVCLPAFKELYPDQYKCVETYSECAHTNGWTTSRRSEMMVHCLLGGTQEKTPRIALQHFAKSEDCPINFKHDCFMKIVGYLQLFASRAV